LCSQQEYIDQVQNQNYQEPGVLEEERRIVIE